jgi:act minimal PKS ketosynthase (KS/KS alpha)
VVPLTANLHEPDPACDLDSGPGESRQQAAACALSISAGIGGSNAAVVLRAV